MLIEINGYKISVTGWISSSFRTSWWDFRYFLLLVHRAHTSHFSWLRAGHWQHWHSLDLAITASKSPGRPRIGKTKENPKNNEDRNIMSQSHLNWNNVQAWFEIRASGWEQFFLWKVYFNGWNSVIPIYASFQVLNYNSL